MFGLDAMPIIMPKKPELEKFRTLYLTFAKAMLKETSIKNQAAGKKDILVQNYQFSGGEYSMFPRHATAQEQYIPSPDDDVFPQTIAKKCADVFFSSGLASGFKISDNSGNPVENPSLERLRPFIIVRVLDLPIRQLVLSYDRTSFSRRQILACLDRYIAHWTGEVATDPKYAPIYNFETEVQAIKLNRYVSIVRFTDEEKTRIMNALGPLEKSINIWNYASASHVAKLRPIDGPCGEDEKRDIQMHARKALQCAVTSLRLLKPEGVGTTGFIRCPDLAGIWGARFGPLEDFDLPWNSMSRFRGLYVLDRGTLSRFRVLYKILSANQFEKWDGLKLLLRQFNRSCQRERDEDRILDYAICLESALLSDVGTELSYRLALRAAKLLRVRRDPKKTFEHMQCIYSVRSKIVHSNQSLGNPAIKREITRIGMQPREFMRSTDTLMRELLSTIIQRVSRQNAFKTLCKDLDGEIVNSL